MPIPPPATDEQRQRLFSNLNAVARHMASGGTMPGKFPGAAEPPVDRARSSSKGVLTGLGATAAAAAGAVKFAKFGKFLLTAATIAASIWAYAQSNPLSFAVGFVALIFVHEMGHAVVIKAVGLKASWPVFIPFWGAFIALKGQLKSALIHAQIGIAGPVAGGVGAGACAAIYAATGDPLFVHLALVGCWLNLFNLLPIPPLDGSAVIPAVHPASVWLGAIGLGVAAYLSSAPMLTIAALVMVFQAFASLGRARGADAPYYAVPVGWRSLMTALYFGLCAALGLGSALAAPEVARHRSAPGEPQPPATTAPQAPSADVDPGP